MKRRRHTPEQIVRKLREVERLLGEGQTIAEAAKQVEISEQTYHRWRNQYGGMKADDAKRLRELERENARLKRIVADKELEIDALKEIARRRRAPSTRPRSRRVRRRGAARSVSPCGAACAARSCRRPATRGSSRGAHRAAALAVGARGPAPSYRATPSRTCTAAADGCSKIVRSVVATSRLGALWHPA